MFKRAPKLLCADKGWCIGRDAVDGGTEYLLAADDRDTQVWGPDHTAALVTTDHSLALEWLARVERSKSG